MSLDGKPGREIGRRELILGTAFGCTAGAAWACTPTKHLDFLGKLKLEDVVPKSFGGWDFVTSSGLVVPPEDQLSQSLYSQLMTRIYSKGDNPPVMLLAAYSAGQTGILQVHRPETCYRAGGFSLSKVTSAEVALGDREFSALRLDASSDGFDEHIVYWTRVGREMPGSWGAQRWSIAKQNLQGLIPDAILVRVSTRSGDRPGSYALLDKFVQAMIASVAPIHRSVFIA